MKLYVILQFVFINMLYSYIVPIYIYIFNHFPCLKNRRSTNLVTSNRWNPTEAQQSVSGSRQPGDGVWVLVVSHRSGRTSCVSLYLYITIYCISMWIFYVCIYTFIFKSIYLSVCIRYTYIVGDSFVYVLLHCTSAVYM